MDLDRLQGGTALVTGAASGIGRATALAFAERGANLAICDLDADRLAETEKEIRNLGRDVIAARVDVANPDDMEEFAARVHSEVPAVDVLMNNAGVAIAGSFLDTSLADWDWILGVNVKGVVHGCHFFLPKMIERGRGGHVVNVASAAGYLASDALGAYCTTKFAVVGLSESLLDGLHPHGIGVTAVCPGLINTPITRAARLVGADGTPEAREEMVRVYERRNYSAERVAANILKAIARNRPVAPISPEAWVMYIVKRLSPRLTWWITRRMGAVRQRRLDAAKRA